MQWQCDLVPSLLPSLSLLDLLVEFGRADDGDGLRQHHLVWAVGVQVDAGQEGGLSRVRLWSTPDLSHIWENCKPLTDIWGNNHFKIITRSWSSTRGSGRGTWYSNSLHNIACYWISMADMNYISREGRNVMWGRDWHESSPGWWGCAGPAPETAPLHSLCRSNLDRHTVSARSRVSPWTRSYSATGAHTHTHTRSI